MKWYFSVCLRLTWMDKTLLLLLILFSWSECPFCKLFLLCSIRDSEGGLRPMQLLSLMLSCMMLTDMCCRTTRFTADADSANNDNCLAELSLRK